MSFRARIFPLLSISATLALSACSHVVVDPLIRTSEPVPPLVVVEQPSPAVIESIEAPMPPQKEPTFADLSPSAWAVQVAALKSLDMIEQIEAKHPELDNALRVPTHDQELGNLHVVIVGIYETEAEAARRAGALPPKIAGDEPWIRTVGSVQAVMR